MREPDEPDVPDEPLTADRVLEHLRAEPENPHLFGGFGPLVLAAIVALAITLAIPSIAPERVTQVPVEDVPAAEPEAGP